MKIISKKYQITTINTMKKTKNKFYNNKKNIIKKILKI